MTAEALDQSGSTRLATHTAETGGTAVQIRLSLDAPSQTFGTGDKLVNDGQDVALVRAELVDSRGRLVSPRDNSTNTTTPTNSSTTNLYLPLRLPHPPLSRLFLAFDLFEKV